MGKRGPLIISLSSKKSATPTSFILKSKRVWHSSIAPNFESMIGSLSFDFDAQSDTYVSGPPERTGGGGEITYKLVCFLTFLGLE